jgi:PAS domain S-box-containing protein
MRVQHASKGESIGRWYLSILWDQPERQTAFDDVGGDSGASADALVLQSAADRYQSTIDIAGGDVHRSVMEDCRETTVVQDEFRRVVDALPGLVWTARPDGYVDFLNQRWCEYTGISVDEGYGQGWQKAIHPEDLPEMLERWQSILASGEPREMEARFRRHDGEYRWFLIRAVPVHDERGNVVQWYGINADIDDQATERKRSQSSLTRARDALMKSEGRLRTIIDTIPVIAWCTSPDGSGEFWNQRWHDYTGLSPEAARGWGWQAAIHPDDLVEIRDTWLRHLDVGQAGEVEGRLRSFDGEYRWFLFRFEPLRDEAGNIVNWYGTNTGIDDRKRAEALQAGEKRLLEMVASGHSLSVVLDMLCRIVEELASGCYCCIYLVDSTGTRFRRGAMPSLPSDYYESKATIVQRDSGPCGMAASLKTQVIVPDVASETRWDAHKWRAQTLAHGLRSCWSTPILSRAEETLGTFAIYHREAGSPTPFHQALIEQFTHIASIAIERARSEDALRRSEAFLAEAQHLSSTGSYSWHSVTDEITLSEEAYRIFELDMAAPATLDLIASRVHPEDLPALKELVERCRTDSKDMEFDYSDDMESDFRLQMPDGSVKYLHVVAHGSRDEHGQLEYVGAIQDLTQRQLSEDALGKLRSELARVARVTSLGALTASIAHEVNQPLSGIITNANTCLRMLNADPPNLDGARETARRAIRDGNRASDVIKRLRALFGKSDAAIETVDLNVATREVIALTLNELQRSRVILRAELAEDLPPVTGDRVQLQQVILNLLLNASEAMSLIEDRPRQLVVRTERDENDRISLSVQDAGVGFEPEYVNRLFEAFYTTKSGGMGIGLSVSRSIIESHGGRLSAAANDGPGATFSFSIPRASESVMGTYTLDSIQTTAVKDSEQVVRNL